MGPAERRTGVICQSGVRQQAILSAECGVRSAELGVGRGEETAGSDGSELAGFSMIGGPGPRRAIAGTRFHVVGESGSEAGERLFESGGETRGATRRAPGTKGKAGEYFVRAEGCAAPGAREHGELLELIDQFERFRVIWKAVRVWRKIRHGQPAGYLQLS